MTAKIGPHVNRYHAKKRNSKDRPLICDEIEAARKEAENEGGFAITAAQIFVGGPQERKITLTDQEAETLRQYCARTGMVVIAHSAYSANPWTGDPDAARHIRAELEVCARAGISGLVVHLPKLPVERVMRYIRRLIEAPTAEGPMAAAPGPRIYLETPAVVPMETYYETPEKLRELFMAIRAEIDPGLERFGLCFDTAHLWVSGIDFGTAAGSQDWFDRLDAIRDVLPPHCIMGHLNDSQRARGRGPDTHAALGQGQIWNGAGESEGEPALRPVLAWAERTGAVLILERKPKEALTGDYQLLARS